LPLWYDLTLAEEEMIQDPEAVRSVALGEAGLSITALMHGKRASLGLKTGGHCAVCCASPLTEERLMFDDVDPDFDNLYKDVKLHEENILKLQRQIDAAITQFKETTQVRAPQL
jgi:hypothetical protein